MKLRELKGLGPTTEKQLAAIGITTPDELRAIGAVEAFIRLKRNGDITPSINFLYAMIGALEDRSWLDIAKNEKESILMSLEGFAELEKSLLEEGIKIEI